MRWLLCLLVVIGSLCGSAAHAEDELRYGPAPAWVKAVSIPTDRPSPGGSIQALLLNKQVYFGERTTEVYIETAFKILSVQGLQELGALMTEWDPATQALTVNRAAILRDGKEIDLLADGVRFTTLRREANLNKAILDGNLTAILEVKGLRVGDVVNLSYSWVFSDRVLGEHAEDTVAIRHPGKVGRLVYREVWAKSKQVRWRATPQYGEVKKTETDREIELLYDHTDVEAPVPPADAPSRFAIPARLELTDFKAWSDISVLMAPLYQKAAVLAPDSPLRAEVEKIKASNKEPEARALAALKLVESQVRYLAVTIGAGGLTPAAADTTWQARFGDCKAKTALLIALLNELGIKAEPALVDSTGGDGMDDQLPQVGAFDHVIVRAEIGGKTYWLDGTRTGDRRLDSPSGVPFIWALPVRIAGAPLEKPERLRARAPLMEWLTEIDASAGLDVEGPGRVRVLFRGDEGLAIEQVLAAMTKEESDKIIKERWGDQIGWLTVETTELGWDDALEGFKIEFRGRGKLDWIRRGGARGVAFDSSFDGVFEARPAGPGANAPYALDFPVYTLDTNRVRLPKNSGGFSLIGADVDATVGGLAIKRTAKIANGEALIVTSIQSLTSEVSSDDAMAAQKTIAALPIVNDVQIRMAAAGGPPAKVQAEANDLMRLAEQNFSSKNNGEALNYVNRALKLDAKNTQALRLRSILYGASKNYAAALKDAQAANRLAPTPLGVSHEINLLLEVGRYREALSRADAVQKARPGDRESAELRLSALAGLGRAKDVAAGLDALIADGEADLWDIDIDSLVHVVAKQPDKARDAFVRNLASEPQSPSARLIYGAILSEKDPKAALGQIEQALLIKPEFGLALLQRVTLLARQKNYEQMLPDLDRLMSIYPKDPDLLLTRAQVHTELKRHDKAVADYDAAVRLGPGDPNLLNGSCWERATANIELERALADCSEAVRLRPAYAEAWDSRGLVNLRLDRLADSISDYDRSLSTRDEAGSFFGRGLAKRKAGDVEGGDADIAKAVKLDPAIAKTFEGYGLKP